MYAVVQIGSSTLRSAWGTNRIVPPRFCAWTAGRPTDAVAATAAAPAMKWRRRVRPKECGSGSRRAGRALWRHRRAPARPLIRPMTGSSSPKRVRRRPRPKPRLLLLLLRHGGLGRLKPDLAVGPVTERLG